MSTRELRKELTLVLAFEFLSMKMFEGMAEAPPPIPFDRR